MFKQFRNECWEWAYGKSSHWAWVKWLGAVSTVCTALPFTFHPQWAKQVPDQVAYGVKSIPILGLIVFVTRLSLSPYYVWRRNREAIEAEKEKAAALLDSERKSFALLLEAEKNATARAIAENQRLQTLFDTKPLNAIQKRNKFDEFIESGNTIYNRLLAEDGESALPDAVKWMEELQAFATVQLAFQDYKALHDVGPDFALVVSTAMQMEQGGERHMREVTATLASRLLKIKRLRNQVTDWTPPPAN